MTRSTTRPRFTDTPIDGIKRGMFIVIISHEYPEYHELPGALPWHRPEYAVWYNGLPLEVLEVSLPFLAVTNGKECFAIDVRSTKVRQVTKRYAKALAHPDRPAEIVQQRRAAGRRRKEKPDKRTCPLCRSRMVQRLQVVNNQRHWVWYCKECERANGIATLND